MAVRVKHSYEEQNKNKCSLTSGLCLIEKRHDHAVYCSTFVYYVPTNNQSGQGSDKCSLTAGLCLTEYGHHLADHCSTFDYHFHLFVVCRFTVRQLRFHTLFILRHQSK